MQRKNILIFGLSLLIAFLVYLWFFSLNNGDILITAGVKNYTAIVGRQNTLCKRDPCRIKVKTGVRTIKVIKDGYRPVTAGTFVKRGKLTEVTVELPKIFTLELTPILPPEPKDDAPLPNDLAKQALAYTWNTDETKLLYLDKADERIKIRGENGVRVVTLLKSIQIPFALYWSPDEGMLIGQKGDQLYIINVDESSRKKLLADFTPTFILWSPKSDYALLNDDKNRLYRFDPETRQITLLDKKLKLNQVAWEDGNALLAFETDLEENETEIFRYYPETGEEKTIISKYAFPLEKMVYDHDKQAAYFFNPEEKGWYEAEM